MNNKVTAILLTIAVAVMSGCQKIDLAGGKGKTPATIPGVAPVNEMKPHAVPQAESGPPLSGYWKMAYSVNGEVKSAHVRLTQSGNSFTGEGTDDHNNKAFVIEKGTLQDGVVGFLKRYQDNAAALPVEYGGNLDMSQGGYISGRYLASANGQSVEGDWEAEKDKPEAPASSSGSHSQAPSPAHQSRRPDHAPDLSGKWDTGYEYQFKTIHSTMWLMQENNKLHGHGIDHSTKEKFTIDEGWYAFPKVTLIRKYAAIKSKKVNKPERKMTFKADVNWITEADYDGPYLQGKTDGGGNWEAQLVR